MPKKEIDYSKTVIYKIQHNSKKELIYIGSTTNFTKRKTHHRCSSITNIQKRQYLIKLYVMIRENGGWNEFEMVPIKEAERRG